MANIRKRGDGQWQVQIRRAGFPSQCKTFEQKADAEAWARKVESEMDVGIFVDRRLLKIVLLKDLLERYEKEITPGKKGAKAEKSKLKVLRSAKLAKKAVAYIDAFDIVEYRDVRLKQVAPATVIKEMNLLSNVFNIARSEWCMRGLENPVVGVRRPKVARERNRRLDAKGEELRRVLEASESQVLRALITVAIETAMRRGEMVNIRRCDLDLERRVITLRDTKNGESRNVPLSSRAIEEIKKLPEREGDQLFGMKADSVTHAFRQSVRRARAIYEKECEEEGVSPDPKLLIDLRLHDARHEATSRFFEKGLNTMEAAAITGHKDLRQLKRYTHLRAEDLAKKLG